MGAIKFCHNWNNKLNCKYFSTIRKHTEQKHQYYQNKIGHVYNVVLNGRTISTAILVGVRTSQYSNLPRELITLDTGIINYTEQDNLFKKFGIQINDNVIVLLFHLQGIKNG